MFNAFVKFGDIKGDVSDTRGRQIEDGDLDLIVGNQGPEPIDGQQAHTGDLSVVGEVGLPAVQFDLMT